MSPPIEVVRSASGVRWDGENICNVEIRRANIFFWPNWMAMTVRARTFRGLRRSPIVEQRVPINGYLRCCPRQRPAPLPFFPRRLGAERVRMERSAGHFLSRNDARRLAYSEKGEARNQNEQKSSPPPNFATSYALPKLPAVSPNATC
jgi:hypothetical protein